MKPYAAQHTYQAALDRDDGAHPCLMLAAANVLDANLRPSLCESQRRKADNFLARAPLYLPSTQLSYA